MNGLKDNQGVSRLAALLRAVSAARGTESTTTGLAKATGIARPTVHRLLTGLAEEGFVDRDSATGLWSLGPELYLLGAGAAERYDISDRARDIVDALARETGESAFLSARRADETVCLLSQEGSFPLRSHVLHVGIRLPLGVASAGLAILTHLPDRERDAYLSRVQLENRWGAAHSDAPLRERIAESLRTGYAVNPGLLVEGSWGVGAAVFDRTGSPAWALSLTGVETRFRGARVAELGSLLLRHAHRLSLRLQ